ncbi:SusC/RagA family TonB-linked outer membrane protein [Pedobacter miscanthi]|jgi:TonB-linked SusC/RagA family outer membrane protein|uniref:SusC/RagA family TonB-linked outer membrane protein n=1 Tax=Pedobacter miscanthi TaxID=2259170 RepID=UPI00292FA89B|nr:SusC/RagA family TonB-linked outer membrane protein [Pedobacter miscanthi]
MKIKLYKYYLLLVLTVFFMTANSQNKQLNIKGAVLDKTNQPIVGVSISIVGAVNAKSTLTDQNGNFKITTAPNTTLRVSYMGFVTQQITVRSETELRIILLDDTKSLSEVVITAMGIKQDAKSLAYARQSIDVSSMTDARGSSLLDMLSGKAAGMQIVSGGGPGASTRVVIRGNNSLTGNNQPLFVIDGIPVLNNSGENGDLDFGSPVNSISPDEIENVEILKGANAAALYGSDAANGVVLITTKKAGRKQGLGISYGFNMMLGNLYNFPTLQNIYGAGQTGQFKREGINYFGNSGNGVSFDPNLPYGIWNPNMGNQDQRSWGMPMLGFDVVGRNGKVKQYIPQPGTIESMYKTSNAITNSFSIDKLTDAMSFRLSYTGQSADDILEKFNLFDRHNFNIRSTAKITDYLDLDANIRYTYENMDNRGFRNSSNRNPLYVIANLPRDASYEELVPWKQNGGTPFNFNGFTNPYWLLNETSNQDSKNFLNANLTANIRLNQLLRLRLTAATDLQQSKGWDFTNLYTPFDIDGEYYKWSRISTNNNFNALLSFNKKINNDFNLNSNFGASLQTVKADRMSSRAFMLITPDLNSLANAKGIIGAVEEPEAKNKQALFGMANLGYKNWAFLEATARNEWSSTLPSANNSYFYYSLGSSIVVTDAFKINKKILSYLKLRGSFAQVGNDTGFDRLYSGYFRNENGSFLGIPFFTGEEVLKNDRLKPEQTRSWEFGSEIKLWNGRVNADVTYYSKSTKNQIVEADAISASGYRREILNAGEIQNSGIEVSLNITPVKTAKFSWSTTFNWSKNRSEVVSLVDGITRYEMGSGDNIRLYAEVGKPYGVFYGNDYKRNADGAIYVGVDGKPKFLPDQYLGSIQPNWFGGWQNTFRIGPVDVGFMFDFQSGGKVWSYTAFRGGIDGNTVQSLDGRYDDLISQLILGENTDERRGFLQPGNTVKPGADYLQNYVRYPDGSRPKGVQLGNTVYDPSVGAFWADKPSMAWVSPMDHWTHNSASSAARYIYDASYIKLREVTVGYSLKSTWFKKTPIKSARVALVGRNLAILFQNTPKGLDPQATSTTGNAQGFERGFSLPMSTWGFDAKLSF